jgi:radical SAM protein (TIGR01212 family)
MPETYYSFANYTRERFGRKIYKIPVDAGFTCPNRDGKVGTGGCAYCENKSFSPNSRNRRVPLDKQIRKGMDFYGSRDKAGGFIVYYQAFTNTYAPVERLEEAYDAAFTFPEVVGISVGTRPDCAPDEVVELLEGYVCVEYGAQSMHDEVLKGINRGHGVAEFVNAVKRTSGRGMRICAHVIIGLPGETREMMLDGARRLAVLPVDDLKIHHLYISRETQFEAMFKDGKIPVMGFEEFVGRACDFLEVIPPKMVIQRLVGEIEGDFLIAPKWGRTKAEVLAEIEAELKRRNSRQGRLFRAW